MECLIIEEGQANPSILNMAREKKEFVWLATQKGDSSYQIAIFNRTTGRIAAIIHQYYPLKERSVGLCRTMPPDFSDNSWFDGLNEGLASEETPTLEIVTLSPWYATWWAISLFVLLALGLLYTTYRFQLSRLQEAGWDRLPNREMGSTGDKSPEKQAPPLFRPLPQVPLPKALVVEDNAEMSRFIKDELSGKFRAIEASNEAEGIAKALKWRPDVIITDVMMPEVDGFELCQKLKKDERTRHIPIVLLTARSDLENRLEGLEYDADAYLIKPFSHREMLMQLIRLTVQRRQMPELKSGPSDEGSLDIQEKEFVKSVQACIRAHLSDTEFDLHVLCRELGMARSPLHKKLKTITGRSTTRYIRAVRLHHAADLLRETALPISDIAYSVGFKDPNFFSTCFKEEFGLAPTHFRNEKQ